jgi:hypothetical protein
LPTSDAHSDGTIPTAIVRGRGRRLSLNHRSV